MKIKGYLLIWWISWAKEKSPNGKNRQRIWADLNKRQRYNWFKQPWNIQPVFLKKCELEKYWNRFYLCICFSNSIKRAFTLITCSVYKYVGNGNSSAWKYKGNCLPKAQFTNKHIDIFKIMYYSVSYDIEIVILKFMFKE